MNETQMIAIVVGAIIIVGVIFAPPLISKFFSGLRDLFEDFRDAWLQDWGDGDEDNLLGVSLMIDYKDGTSKTFKQKGFSPIPLMISDEYGEVNAITGAITITATHDAPSNIGWSVEGQWTILIQGVGELGDPSVGTKVYGYSTSTEFVSGDSYTINQATIRYESDQIEALLTTYGDYTLELSSTLTLMINFGDGQTDTETGSASLNWNFNYSSAGEITSLSISIYNGKIR